MLPRGQRGGSEGRLDQAGTLIQGAPFPPSLALRLLDQRDSIVDLLQLPMLAGLQQVEKV